MATILLESQVQNQFLKFCVGDCVGEHLPAKLFYRPKYTSIVIESQWGIMVSTEKLSKKSCGGSNCVGWDKIK